MAENGGRLFGWPHLSSRSVASSKSEAMVSTIQQMMAKQTRELQASFREEAQKQRAMTQQLVAEQTQQLRGCVEQLEGYLSAKGAAEEGPSAKDGAEEQGGHEGEQDGLRKMVHLNPDRPLPEDGAPEPGGWPALSGQLEEHLSPDGLRGCVEQLEDSLRGSSSQTQQLRGCVEQLEGYLSAKGAAEEGPSTRGGAEEQGGHEGAQDGPRGMSTIDLDSDRISDEPQDGTKEHKISGFQDLRTPASPQHLDRRESLSGSGWCRAQCKKMKKRSGLCVEGMIVANGVFLGFEANEIMTSSDFSMPDRFPWRVASACFALAFLVELVIRWVADGYEFLRHRNEWCWWNLFDTLLILGTVANDVLYLFSNEVLALGAPRGLRLLRLLRVTHITRAFRVVRGLRELNMMITGLASCARPLVWAGVLLFALTYMMGVIVSQLIAECFHSGRHVHLDESVLRYITEHFPDLWWSMYSLFEALTGGRDWGDIAGPFNQVSWVLGALLVLYIFVGIFCILNLLTAVLLDAAQRVDTKDHVYAKRDWVNEVRTFIRTAIKDLPSEGLEHTSVTLNGRETTALITKKHFLTLLDKAENKAYLKENGLDLFLMGQERLGELFDMMDADRSGDIDVDEFVLALYDYKGAANSMDLQRALHMIRSLQTQMEVTFRKAPGSSSSIYTATSGLPLV